MLRVESVEAKSQFFQESEKLFLQKLRKTQEMLGQKKIPFRILDGVAISSYIDPSGCSFFENKKNSHDFDIDVLIPKDKLKNLRVDNRDSPVHIDYSHSERFFDFRPFEQLSFLKHWGLEIPVSTGLFLPVAKRFGGVEIITIDPLTLFHTFVVCGGILRHKDWKKILCLGRIIRMEQQTQFEEKHYTEFHRFIRLRNKLDPFFIKAKKCGDWIEEALPLSLQSSAVKCGKLISRAIYHSY